ncbi:hypothetical protein [Nitrosophilus alvini]|uniref:hypothetical protein n=1 Tax=Nitrosophilus alvini TaxID=2714855 RepID=UPI00190A91B2|nr:hypothetical protein [Nitrosophilus alvini]
MTDSIDVLNTLKLVYTLYALLIISLIWWFGYNVTKKGNGKSIITPKIFYIYLASLAIVGVGIHILTYNKIPWVAWDLKRHMIEPDKLIEIKVKKHKFILPEDKIVINCGEKVKFNLTSDDLTYGFGLFRKNNSMVFQMQVVPGHNNDILWEFHKNGIYTIRSTEYSGPKGAYMVIPDAVEVVGCKENDKYAMK